MSKNPPRIQQTLSSGQRARAHPTEFKTTLTLGFVLQIKKKQQQQCLKSTRVKFLRHTDSIFVLSFESEEAC